MDLDRFYFGLSNENLGADLELNMGIFLTSYINNAAKMKYIPDKHLYICLVITKIYCSIKRFQSKAITSHENCHGC